MYSDRYIYTFTYTISLHTYIYIHIYTYTRTLYIGALSTAHAFLMHALSDDDAADVLTLGPQGLKYLYHAHSATPYKAKVSPTSCWHMDRTLESVASSSMEGSEPGRLMDQTQRVQITKHIGYLHRKVRI